VSAAHECRARSPPARSACCWWHFASGGTRKHSWLEVVGWALDFLGGTLLFTDRWWYRRFNHAKNVKLRDVQATARWLQKHVRAGKGAFFE
jgi:hypothetical protein